MSVCIAVPSEQAEGEARVALTPEIIGRLTGEKLRVLVEQGAGADAGFSDADYKAAGAEVVPADRLPQEAQVLLRVSPPPPEKLRGWRPELLLLGFMDPLRNPELVRLLCEQRHTAFALELLPRSTRAQAMDALSSQRSIAGYRAVLLAAERYGRFLPMLTTPSGTVRPARVLIVGAGVAGLQAIATAKRLGALVEAFDVRSAAREQVESLGARFLDSGISAEGAGGYARVLSEEEKQQQQEFLAKAVTASNLLITTAEIPGRPAPRIISAAMSDQMAAGSVIIDLAAASGGNCEVTQLGTWHTTPQGVQVYGPSNAAAEMAPQASELYARNLYRMLQLLIRDGALQPDWEDDIVRESCLCAQGELRCQAARPQPPSPGEQHSERATQ